MFALFVTLVMGQDVTCVPTFKVNCICANILNAKEKNPKGPQEANHTHIPIEENSKFTLLSVWIHPC